VAEVLADPANATRDLGGALGTDEITRRVIDGLAAAAGTVGSDVSCRAS
jgi:hypothetical protein